MGSSARRHRSSLEEAGCAALVTPGREATVIGAIGERELLATLPLEGFAGVEQVLPILKPYKLVSRELSPDPTVIEVRGRKIGDGYFGFIAGQRGMFSFLGVDTPQVHALREQHHVYMTDDSRINIAEQGSGPLLAVWHGFP